MSMSLKMTSIRFEAISYITLLAILTVLFIYQVRILRTSFPVSEGFLIIEKLSQHYLNKYVKIQSH